jgi:hypothetical protein
VPAFQQFLKYSISDRPHWQQLGLCETYFLLLNGSHLNLKLDLRKTKLFHNRPSSFCSRYPNVCDKTKKIDYSWAGRHKVGQGTIRWGAPPSQNQKPCVPWRTINPSRLLTILTLLHPDLAHSPVCLCITRQFSGIRWFVFQKGPAIKYA